MAHQSLNDFFPSLGTQDTRKKLQLGTDIINYLGNSKNSLDAEDLGAFIDGVLGWLSSSNFKVCTNGLEILSFFVDRMGEDFRPYLSTVLPSTIDRLGDSKDQVREQAQILIQKLTHPVSSPQFICDKLAPHFTHKSWRVREEVMISLQKTLEAHGANSFSLSKLVPHILKLLSDPTSQVRDTAFATLVEIYRNVGERVRVDLQRKSNIPPSKLQIIMAKFDDVRDSGQMLPSANTLLPAASTGLLDQGPLEDEVDRVVVPSNKSSLSATALKRASSAPPVRRTVLSASKPPTSSAQAGAVDEESFIRSFEDVPKVQLFTAKDVEDNLSKCRETLMDTSHDWEKRVEAMRKVRSVVIAGAADYDEFYPSLRSLELPFQLSVKDLRSQVVRETCITIAFLSQTLGQKVDHFAEALLSNLINLIPNSAKIMSTSGTVTIRFIIQHTHASRLIPIITTNMASKSKDIRRACCEFLGQLLHTWPTHALERHIAILQEAIKKGISDADPEARASSRKCVKLISEF